MATQFQSAANRNAWLNFVFSLIVDFIVAFIVSLFFGNAGVGAVMVAILILAAVYGFQMVYGLLGVIKVATLYFLFGKKGRIAATLDQMVAVKMPMPARFYSNAVEYLTGVVNDPTASDDAKLFAGATIGNLEALRLTQHFFLLMTTTTVLEEAIQQYGRKMGFIRRDGTILVQGDDLDDD